jgi:PadR family transcriptional regulator, regulatory protein PadR
MMSTPDTMATRLDLFQGMPDLLVLRTLVGEPRHGWAISERIQEISRDVLGASAV